MNVRKVPVTMFSGGRADRLADVQKLGPGTKALMAKMYRMRHTSAIASTAIKSGEGILEALPQPPFSSSPENNSLMTLASENQDASSAASKHTHAGPRSATPKRKYALALGSVNSRRVTIHCISTTAYAASHGRHDSATWAIPPFCKLPKAPSAEGDAIYAKSIDPHHLRRSTIAHIESTASSRSGPAVRKQELPP
eukprot:6181219-Pleurochrysis_carterae.AAC.2